MILGEIQLGENPSIENDSGIMEVCQSDEEDSFNDNVDFVDLQNELEQSQKSNQKHSKSKSKSNNSMNG